MKTKFLPVLATAFALWCAGCSEDSTSSVLSANDDTIGTADSLSVDTTGTALPDSSDSGDTTKTANNGSIKTFETPGTGSDDNGIYVSGTIDYATSTSSMYIEETEMSDAKGGAITDSYESYVTESPSGATPDMEYEEGYWGDVSNERKSGLLTAGEWNDLENWKSWGETLDSNSYTDMPAYWEIFPKTLVAVQVVDKSKNPLANVSVELLNGNTVEFTAKTDNSGLAYCWVSLFEANAQTAGAEAFSLKVNGKVSEAPVKLTSLNADSLDINVITSDAKQAEAAADIAFIVDATGSMGDEIAFLKSDLEYIIDHASTGISTKLRTAAVFYRDETDVYITRGEDFADDVSTTREYISEQYANGGGDYPEAVHSALETSLQNLSWNESARARIAFLILDAPAHHEGEVIESMQKSIAAFAKNGIKIIPVAASGVDKDTEFMLRFFELSTGGTYVFITNDSGIGYDHIDASVGDHDVEKLSDLMIRLIKKYVE